jgi:hypothetical protein
MEQRLERANVAAVPFSWFTAVEAYGDNPGLRVFSGGLGVNTKWGTGRDRHPTLARDPSALSEARK